MEEEEEMIQSTCSLHDERFKLLNKIALLMFISPSLPLRLRFVAHTRLAAGATDQLQLQKTS